jgi:phosphomevalonate kinase
MSDKTTLVSAPGKVLLAGGFLVLDPQYFGIVISTSARFYTLIRPLPTSSSDSGSIRIKVQAAQFPKEESIWGYDLSLSAGIELKPCSEKDEGNKFVQLTIDCALRYALEVVGEEGVRKGLGSGVEIVVLADNDFYSQSDKVSLLFLFLQDYRRAGSRDLRILRYSRDL